MPSDDARRWDARYRETSYSSFREPRKLIRDYMSVLSPSGRVLDLAMGLGGNAGYLAAHGCTVIGIDISSVAVRQVRAAFPTVQAVIADLEEIRFPPDSVDGILNFYYLQRGLWPEFRRMLKPGGVLFFETLTQDIRQMKPEIDPQFLLYPDELRGAFSDWEILYYFEGWQIREDKQKAVASLVARVRK